MVISALQKIEEGDTRIPRGKTLRKIAKVLGVSLEELRGTDTTPNAAEPTRFIAKYFFEPVLDCPAAAIDFVCAHWGYDAHHAEEHQSAVQDVDRPIRNSRRWTVWTGANRYLLREVRRRAISTPERIQSKHDALIWLSKAGVPVVLPQTVAARPTKALRHVTTPRGTVCELYEDIGQHVSYDMQTNRGQELLRILIRLASISSAIEGGSHKELVEALRGRFTRRHQFEQLRLTRESLRLLAPRLRRKHDYSRISEILEEVRMCLDDRAKYKTARICDKLPLQLVHGDVTENNLLLTPERTWLVDWDTIRIQRGGPFDLAFALCRLALPNRDGEDSYPLGLFSATSEFLANYTAALRTEEQGARYSLEAAIQPRLLCVALEEVRYSFAQRMFEYLRFSADVESHQPKRSYLARCNPGRCRRIREHLFPDEPWWK